jgi:hypothetical protein
LADDAHEVLAQGKIVLQRAIGPVEKVDTLVSDHPGRRTLLVLATPRQLQRIGSSIVRTRVAAGATDESSDRAIAGPLRHRRGCSKIGVVGVGDDHQYALRSMGVSALLGSASVRRLLVCHGRPSLSFVLV